MKKETAVAAIIVVAVLAFVGGYVLGGFDGGVTEGTRPAAGGGSGRYDSNVLPIGESPVRGPEGAPVTLVLFADFSNSSSAAAAGIVNEVASDERFASDVRVVVKVLPGRDDTSRMAAAAALFAADHGRFYDGVYEGLVQHADGLDSDTIHEVLDGAGLDTRAFDEAMEAGRYDAVIDADVNLARSLGVSRAPSVFVNGRNLAGSDLDRGSVREAVFGEQEHAAELTAAGTPADAIYSARVRENADTRSLVARRERPEARGANARDDVVRRPEREAAPEGDAAPTPREARAPAQPPSGDVERLRIPIGDAPVHGAADALVTIQEFSDFHCPFCSRVIPTIEALEEEYGGDLRVVFYQNPLPMHPDSPAAHDAALAAGAQGQFYAMHDLIFANQRDHAPEAYARHAEAIGLDMQAFNNYLASNRGEEIIERDQALAGRVNARGTPHFFINGRRLRGAQPVEAFREVIDSELALARQLMDNGVARADVFERITADSPETAVAEAERPAEPEVVEAPPVGDSHAMGPEDAPVTITIFSEFQCPFCGRAQPTMEQIREEYGDQVRFVFKAFPLPFHSDANLASQAALAAGEQGRFWEYHDVLFQNQRALSRADLERYAQDLSLDMQQFNDALDTGRFAAQVETELSEGRRAGVSGTPTFLINGERLVGAVPFDRFQPIIERHLRDDG